MDTFKCVLIDPKEKSVTAVDVGNALTSWYKELDCSLVQIVALPLRCGEVAAICDEEGLLKDKQKYFTFKPLGTFQRFAGKMLVCNPSLLADKCEDIKQSVDDVFEQIVWR